MRSKVLRLLWVLLAMVSCKDPLAEESSSLSHGYVVATPSMMSLSIPRHSTAERIAVMWNNGDKLFVADDRSSSVAQLMISDVNHEKLNIQYTASSSEATKVFVSSLGRNPDLKGLVVNARPAMDGSLSEACLLTGSAAINAQQIALYPIAGIIKFTVSRTDVSKIVLSEEGNVFLESFNYHLQNGVMDGQEFRHLVEIDAGPSKDYFFPVVSGSSPSKLTVDIYDLSGSLSRHVEVSNDLAFESGRVYDFGEIDHSSDPVIVPQESVLPIPMLFKQAGKDLDYSEETGSGAAWPFKEGKGSYQVNSTEQVFHTNSYEGYPVYFSGERHYLHSRNGWVLTLRSKDDFIEFPTFTKGRIKSVSIAFGSTPCSPSFVDAHGVVLAGGEQQEKIEPGTLYTYEFGDTQMGEPCRMQLNSTEKITVLQVTPTYVFDSRDYPPSNDIESVFLQDDANALFSSGAVGVHGFLKTAGSGMSGVQCGFYYEDYYSVGTFDNVSSDPLSFRYAITSPVSSRYSFRGWAASERGWRDFTEAVCVSPYSILLDFWKEATLYKALGEGTFDASAEQSRTVDQTDYTVFVKGSFTYDTSSGLTVTSSGNAYIRFPAISGKTLSEVCVQTASSSEGGDLLVCRDPASPSSSAISSVCTLSSGSNPLAIACNAAQDNMSYALVFTSSKQYKISRITAVYRNSGSPSAPADDDPDDPSADPSGIFDYSILSGKSHPRLLIDSAGFLELKRKVYSDRNSNLLLADVNDLILSYADIFTSKLKDITYTLDASGKRLLDESQSALLQLSTLSYAYQMTGNPKYLYRARTLLLQICAFPDWHPSHFLDTAEMTMAVALAYDWLYYSLTLEERKMVREKIISYGLSPGLRDDYVRTVNNWNQVCSACMMAGALAVYEKNKQISFQTIEHNVPANISIAGQIYSPDGNYAEGYSYWMYGTGFQTIMMKMLERVFGNNGGMDNIPGLDKTAEYMLFMDGLNASFSYADGGVPDGWAAKIAMWYFAEKSGDTSLLSNEIRMLESGLYSRGIQPRLLFLLPAVLKDFHVDYNVPAHHSNNLWSGGGKAPVVMVHTGWEFNDSDHYLGIKGGAASGVGHAHMDAGSFVYDALGKRWSADPGKMDYAAMELAFKAVGGAGPVGQTNLRWDILKLNNYGHSTISVNAHDRSFQKRYPTDHKYDGAATVTKIINTPSELGAVLDMSAPLEGSVQSATRTIKLVDEKDLVITDVITAKSGFDAPVIWHMITPASIMVKEGYEMLTQGDKTMYLKTTAQPSVEIHYLAGDYVRPPYWFPRTWDEEQTERISGFEANVPAGATVTFMTVISPTLN